MSKYLDGRIDRAFYANDEYVDVAMLETLQDYMRWKAENRLLYYKPATWNDIVNGEKDLDGAYVPYELSKAPLGVLETILPPGHHYHLTPRSAASFGTFHYNSTRLHPSDLPSTYADLLAPRWKGKLVLAYPNDDDAVAYLFSTIILKYGFSWFQTLVRDQEVLWIRSTAKSALALTSGPYSVPGRLLTFTTGEASTLQRAVPDDQAVSWWQRAAIMRSTKCPESARLFLSFLLSDAWQGPISQAGAGVPLNSLSAASGIDVFASNSTQTQGFRDYMMDRALAERWRFQFEDLLGPPKGPDPAAFQ